MRPSSVLNLIEAVADFVFYLLCLATILLVPLVWLSQLFTGKVGGWWLIAALIVFVLVLPTLVPLASDWLLRWLERLRKGELLPWLFKPIKAISAVLGIYGVFKLEYALVHGMEKADDASWAALLWQFITAF